MPEVITDKMETYDLIQTKKEKGYSRQMLIRTRDREAKDAPVNI